MKNYSKLFFLLLFFFFYIKVIAKSFDDHSFICADEKGPIVEFPIPRFESNKIKKEITIKLLKKENRNQNLSKRGIIQKKSSPIDNSYFFYHVNYISNDKKTKNKKFEFYPPSLALFQIEGAQFVDLVCWQKKLN